MVWVVEFDAEAVVHDEDAVGVDHGCKSVRNDDNCAVFEILLQLLLDKIIRLKINIRSRLIQDEHLRLPDDSARETEQLLLPDREDVIVVGDERLQTVRTIFLDVLPKFDVF